MKKRFTIIEWLIALGIICMFGVPSWAIEFTRTKNVATNVSCPIINSTSNNTWAIGANNTKFYITTQDGEAAFSTLSQAGANCTIADTSNITGVYNFPLNQTEMNHDRVFVVYNGTGCLQQGFVINTVARGLLTAINDTVNSATVGNSVIKDLASGANATVNHATYGNSALNTLLGKVDANTTAINQTVNHATYGNSAINTLLGLVNANTTSINATVNSGTKGLVKTFDKMDGLTNVTLAATQTGVTIPTVTTLTTWDKTGYSIADSTSDSVIADAVWNGATASYGTANTYGALVEADLDTNIGSRGVSNLTASDNIGINWGDITNPTSTVGLTGTTIATSQAIASVSGAVGSVTGTIGGNVNGSVVGNVNGNVGGNVNGTANLNATLSY